MENESLNPYPEPQGPFPGKEPIEPFEESLGQPSPFDSSLAHVKEELLFFLEELQLIVKNVATLDRASEKEWTHRFSELKKQLASFSNGKTLCMHLEHLEREFEKLRSHPFARLQQSLSKEIQSLQDSLKTKN